MPTLTHVFVFKEALMRYDFSPINIRDTKKGTFLCLFCSSSWLPSTVLRFAQDKLLAQSMRNKKAFSHLTKGFICSSSWARTKDPLINSQML
jgi:hypothetical protein